MSGYARIHRTLLGHPAFRNDAEAMAFAWLVVRAAWKPSRVRYKEHAISLGRGQLAISIRDFALAMDRDKAWVERLLKRLKSETMVKTERETGVTVITICNYDDYQGDTISRETASETPDKTDARQGRDTEQVREEDKKKEETAAQSVRAVRQPVSDAIRVWNEVAGQIGWPTAKSSSDKRQRAIAARLREHGFEAWKAAIARARASPYLGSSDPPTWFCLDWLAKPENFPKVTEGNYDRRRSDSRSSPTADTWNALNPSADAAF